MQPFAPLLAKLRTEFRHAWFPTLLICSMVILHDLATGIQHGGLVVALLIAAFVLAPRLAPPALAAAELAPQPDLCRHHPGCDPGLPGHARLAEAVRPMTMTIMLR